MFFRVCVMCLKAKKVNLLHNGKIYNIDPITRVIIKESYHTRVYFNMMIGKFSDILLFFH